MRTIHCARCGLDLPIEAFYVGKVKPGTKRGRCKKCSSIYSREWNLQHPERAFASRARHEANHPERSLAWRRANKAHLKDLTYKWRAENPEQWKEICRRSRANNKEKILIRNREREIAEGRARAPWGDRKAMQAIYAEAKKLTRDTGIAHDVDHIIPLRGEKVSGLHVENNLQIMLASKNRAKFNNFDGVVA